MARMQEFYKKEVMPQLREQFKYASVMEVPRITKITLNMGVGEVGGEIGPPGDLDHLLADGGPFQGVGDVAAHIVEGDGDFRHRGGIHRRRRELESQRGEGHPLAAVAGSTGLQPGGEVGVIADHPDRLVKGWMPDFQRIENHRSGRG